jgi:hypothetical protein
VVPVNCILRPVAAGRVADQEILERRAHMCAATFPLTDDVVTFGDQIGGTPGGRGPETPSENRLYYKRFNVFTAATRRMQRILQERVGRGKFIDNIGIVGRSPQAGKPATEHCLVVGFLAHTNTLTEFAVLRCFCAIVKVGSEEHATEPGQPEEISTVKMCGHSDSCVQLRCTIISFSSSFMAEE